MLKIVIISWGNYNRILIFFLTLEIFGKDLRGFVVLFQRMEYPMILKVSGIL